MLIGKQERCRLVGCDGSVTFKAARRYGQPFIALVDVTTHRIEAS